MPGVVAEQLPSAFSRPAAYGDLAAAVLALLSLIGLRSGWGAARFLVWSFSVIGTVDLLYALGRGFSLEAQLTMGATWYIPT